MTNPTHKLALAITAAILAAGGAQAYDLTLSTNMPPITFHGFASQGFLYSGDYNYLANDTKNGSFQFSEIGLNVSMNPLPRTRIAVQGFDYDVGNVGQYDPFLDYALIEYTFNDDIGIRAGRIRRPAGIYNAIQDIDVARTYILLPQGIYDARWRDWSSSLDGGEFFGNIPLSKAGSLAYEVYAGTVTMEENGGVSRFIAEGNAITVDTLYTCPTYGLQLWYSPPVAGLRAGVSLSYMQDFGFNAHAVSGFPVPGHPGVVLPEVYDPIIAKDNVLIQQYSLEYIWKSWTFQAEYYTYEYSGNTYLNYSIPAIHVQGKATQKFDISPQSWYVAASDRINKYVEVGAYYSQYKGDQFSNSDTYQNDAALTLRLDPFSWWTFKVEGHYIMGTGLVRDAADNPVRNDNGWFMLAVKTTLTF